MGASFYANAFGTATLFGYCTSSLYRTVKELHEIQTKFEDYKFMQIVIASISYAKIVPSKMRCIPEPDEVVQQIR